MALGQPCTAGLPWESRVGGVNRLRNFNCSLLALCVETLPCWNGQWLDLGNSTAGEERRGRGALTWHEGSVTDEQLLRDTAHPPQESHWEEQDLGREGKIKDSCAIRTNLKAGCSGR